MEAECTACADVQFILKHDARERFHQPDHDGFMAALQRQFDSHVKAVHSKKPED